MTTWLVCKRCDVKEALLATTPVVGCQSCGAPRYAVNDDGDPMLVYSKIEDWDNWVIANTGHADF